MRMINLFAGILCATVALINMQAEEYELATLNTVLALINFAIWLARCTS